MRFFYGALVLLRAWLVLSPGYVHPDEFFQGPEPLSENGVLPWEWMPKNALRCVAIPYVCWHWPRVALIPGAPWWGVRVVPLLLSFVVDLFLEKCGGGEVSRLLWASSWPALVLQIRSLSNGIEAAAVAAVALLQHSSWGTIGVGAVGAVGLWARFTFPAFCVTYLTLPPRPRTIMAAVVVAALLVVGDWAYYGRWTLTPVNAFIYNSQTDNVAQHGLHPRFLHAVVNLPLLLGPVLVWRLRFQSAWLIPLAVLSISPHQEPRFLLPLVAPAIASSAVSTGASSMGMGAWAIHLSYHGLMTVFFGHLHQAGVIPSLLGGSGPAEYRKTYPPPKHLVVVAGSGVVDDDNLVVAPYHVMATNNEYQLEQCWGPHVTTEDLTFNVEHWKLCRFRRTRRQAFSKPSSP